MERYLSALEQAAVLTAESRRKEEAAACGRRSWRANKRSARLRCWPTALLASCDVRCNVAGSIPLPVAFRQNRTNRVAQQALSATASGRRTGIGANSWAFHTMSRIGWTPPARLHSENSAAFSPDYAAAKVC